MLHIMFSPHESPNPCLLIVLGITGVFKCCCSWCTKQLFRVSYSLYCHCTSWNLSHNFKSQCLRLKTWLLKQERSQWNVQFSLRCFYGQELIVLFSLWAELKTFQQSWIGVFFLHFIAMARVFQLYQLYVLGTKAMRQIHVLVGERRRKCCFRNQKALVANFKCSSIWQTIKRQ